MAPDLTKGNSLALPVVRLLNSLNVTRPRGARPESGVSAKAYCTREGWVLALGPIVKLGYLPKCEGEKAMWWEHERLGSVSLGP